MARPSKLTPQRSRRLLSLIRSGHYLSVAAAACGLHPQTVGNWFDRGERARSGKFFEFFAAFNAAQAEAEIRLLAVITKAATSGDWRAAFEVLARRHPDRWSAKSRIDVGVKPPIDEAIEAELRRLGIGPDAAPEPSVNGADRF